jgi:prepilin-type N-terminal cleavage/methylation domain-containing protein
MRRKLAGFTLIELLIVIVIIGLGLTLAVPSFQGMFARNSRAVLVNDYLLAINLSRSEAMRRGSVVSIQSTDDGAEADNEFGNGYCVQIGQPGATGFSESCTYSAAKCSPAQTTGCVLRNFEPLNGTNRLDSAEGVDAITFGGLGELTGGAVRNLDMCVQGQDGRRIHIALVGRSRSHQIDDANNAKRPAC